MLVYCRTNKVNNKVYIGQCSRQGDDPRWKECLYEAKKGKGWLLGRAIRKYGSDVFKKEIIYRAKSQHELDRMETFFIIIYQSYLPEYGYNMNLGGRGGLGRVITQEAKDHLRVLNLGKPSKLKGKKYAEIYGESALLRIEKNRLGHLGKPSPLRGKKASDKAIEANRRGHIGKPSSAKGKKHSLQARENNRRGQLGKVMTGQACKNMSIAQSLSRSLASKEQEAYRACKISLGRLRGYDSRFISAC